MDTSKEEIVIRRIGRPYFHSGYAYAYKTSCLSYKVEISQKRFSHGSVISEFLKTKTEPFNEETIAEENINPIITLKSWVGPILKHAGHPVFELPRQLNHSSIAKDTAMIVQPCFNTEATLLVLDFLIELINIEDENRANKELLFADWDKKFNKLINQLSKTALQGFNPIHFLAAAHELDIPWLHLSENLIQLGTGKRARWIDSSLTDKTPAISSKIARNKSLTAKLLGKAGLPVPRHFFALSADDAIKHAQSLGYPVVVKPANLDGGVGVQANIHDPTAVRKAFENAKKLSEQILIEKHVPGNDYRLQIVNGEVHGILERVPGGVTGDGKSSILELMIEQNNIRKNAVDDRRYLHQISKDDESTAQLSIQGMKWESIPDAGIFVRLRGAANVASGGIPVPIPVEDAHPDNLAMAIRAVRILKLDIAGVDLLIPDIRESWLESGAYICEINAQPQMFTTMHKPMLQSLFPEGHSRVPMIIHLTENSAKNYIGHQIHKQLSQIGISTGFIHDDKACLGDSVIKQGIGNAFSGGRMLVYDQNVEAMVISSDDISFLQQGWPTDRCDVLILEALPIVLEDSQASPPISDWLNTSSELNVTLLVVAEHMQAEVVKWLRQWKQKPHLISCNFSNHQQIDQVVLKIISTLK